MKGGPVIKRKIDPNSPTTRKNRHKNAQLPNTDQSCDDRFSAIPIGITTGVLTGAGGQAQTSFLASGQEPLFSGAGFEELEEEQAEQLRFGYTNSELFFFITSLTPIEYLVFTGVIVTVIYIKLNTIEQQVISSLLIDLGVTLANLVEQEAFQKARAAEITNREERNAFIRRQKALEKEIIKVNQEIEQLKQLAEAQRNNRHHPC